MRVSRSTGDVDNAAETARLARWQMQPVSKIVAPFLLPFIALQLSLLKGTHISPWYISVSE